MTDRPAKLSPVATLAVWACPALTLGQTVGWYRHWALDDGGPDACFASPEGMSAMLGAKLAPATIEHDRQLLKRLGLYVTIRRRDARHLGWICVLPADCIARAAKEAQEAGGRLAAYIVGREAWLKRRPPNPGTTEGGTGTPPSLVRGHHRDQSPDTTGRAAALVGGLGGLSSDVLSKAQRSSVVTAPEKGVDADASGRSEKAEESGSITEDVREAFEDTLAKLPKKQADTLRRIAGLKGQR